MDLWQIFAIFFGPALAILGLGLRRAIGSLRMLALLVLCGGLGGYALLVERLARHYSSGLPTPSVLGEGSDAVLMPFCVAAVILGAFGVLLVRFRAGAGR